MATDDTDCDKPDCTEALHQLYEYIDGELDEELVGTDIVIGPRAAKPLSLAIPD